MKKVSTAAAKQIRNFSGQKLTIGLALGDRSSWYCILDEAGGVLLEQRLSTTPKAMWEVFGAMPRCRIALGDGHAFAVGEPVVERTRARSDRGACTQRAFDRGKPKERRPSGCANAGAVGADRSATAGSGKTSQRESAGRTVIRARAGLVRARTSLINTARGLTKSYGERLRGCNPRNVNPEKAQGLSPELQAGLEPLLAAVEALSEQIREYNERIEQLAQQSYPQVGLLKQVKGVGTLIALTYLLTLEDPHRFRKSRDVGCYVGLQPGRRNSGQSEPQLHISKEGDPYLRTLLVQGAHHILGPFGADSDLRRWGLKLAERGGKNGKKRAVIATARKLAVLLHRLWVSGEVYEPPRNNREGSSLVEESS